jgi:hypothetical protein
MMPHGEQTRRANLIEHNSRRPQRTESALISVSIGLSTPMSRWPSYLVRNFSYFILRKL